MLKIAPEIYEEKISNMILKGGDFNYKRDSFGEYGICISCAIQISGVKI